MPKALAHEQIQRFIGDGYLAPMKLVEEAEALELGTPLEAFERLRLELGGKLDLKANLVCDWIDALARRDCVLDIIEDHLGPNILN